MSARILVNAVGANMGGALRHLRGFIQGLSSVPCEHEFWFCVRSDVELPAPSPNIHVVPVSSGLSLGRQLYWHEVIVNRLAREHHVDVILSILNFGPSHPAVRQVVFQRNPIYFSAAYLGQVGLRDRVEARLRRGLTHWTMKGSDRIVTPSRAMRELIRSVYSGVPLDKFHVIPHGFDADDFPRQVAPLPETVHSALADGPRDALRLLYATHPAPHKGVDVLIRSLRIIRDSGIHARLFLTFGLNDWPQGVGRYHALVHELGLEADVVFLGRVPQQSIAAVYKACDVFAFPSLCESFGFPMLEAMSAALPVVAADTPINREILGDAAAFYAPLDAHAAATQIIMLAKDRALTDRMSDASRRRVTEIDWSWRRYTTDVLALIDS